MSQVFSGDSVNGATPITVTTTAETSGANTNFLNPPFGNAKAVVFGNMSLTVGAGTTGVTLAIRRNLNAENLIVVQTPIIQVTAGNVVDLSVQVADVIPDGRGVQYWLSVVQTGATGNGTIQKANITALLISG